jgi:hypothetical protein
MNHKPVSMLATLPLCALLAGCGMAPPPPAASAAQIAVAPAPPPVLTRSLYGKDWTGGLSEDNLQRVLESPIDLQFPARIGVIPLAQPFNASAGVALSTRAAASRDLAGALIGKASFSHVSDIATDLPNGGGLEGLRVIAARYRLRYLLLYSERFEDATHVNGWAWFYPTVLGMFVVPGVTVQSHGIAQADLLDVRSGTILFSVMEPMEVSEKELMVGAARSHGDLQAKAASAAARRLAARVASQTDALLASAEEEGGGSRRVHVRILPAPVLAEAKPVERAPL